MKVVPLLSVGCVFALIACSSDYSSKAVFHPDVGPFDENGDYVVAMADEPVTSHPFSRSGRKKAPKPAPVRAPEPVRVRQMAQVTPPPLSRPPASVAVPVSSPVQTPSQPVLIARSPRPVATPVIAQAVRTPVAQVPVVQAAPVQAPVVTPQPTPEPVLVKPQKKAPVRHIVKKSDTLFGLSRKYGVSVGSIQRANGLKGSNILTGKSLVIPR